MELLSLAFMRRALIAAALAGLASPAIGTYVVQRRLALLGDGLGHVAIAGVGLALLTGTAPLPVAVAVCVAGALLIEVLRQRGKATGDIGLAVLFYGGLAAGVLMASAAGQGAGSLSAYLFGSLTTVSWTDLAFVAVLAAIILAAGIGWSRRLFAVCADESYARVLGLKVDFYNYAIVILAAVTVTTAMRTVGLLLVSALMVIPVATAQNLVRGFFRGLGAAMAIGFAVATGGVVASFYADLAPGALIVVLAIVCFALSWPVAKLSHRHRRRHIDDADPRPAPHAPASVGHADHVHGPDCGHLAVEHGDHVDYVHAGHRCAPHEDHYDEH
ncbi:MAG: metal ABC transporter permease [Propionibacteriaceae bacterium]|jgi:zinc transport system permease protein|nr:metal ABC transporter permease [Propionibacteriaceae bacterium]